MGCKYFLKMNTDHFKLSEISSVFQNFKSMTGVPTGKKNNDIRSQNTGQFTTVKNSKIIMHIVCQLITQMTTVPRVAVIDKLNTSIPDVLMDTRVRNATRKFLKSHPKVSHF